MRYFEDVIAGIDGSEAAFVGYIHNTVRKSTRTPRPSVLVIPGAVRHDFGP